MMILDTMMPVVTVEPVNEASYDWDKYSLSVFLTASTNLGPDIVQYKSDEAAEYQDIPTTMGARGPGGVVMREREVSASGWYRVVANTRQTGGDRRSFYLHLKQSDATSLTVTILPETTHATWIFGDFDPVKIEGTLVTIHIEKGAVVSIEHEDGTGQRRPTQWEKLGEDVF